MKWVRVVPFLLAGLVVMGFTARSASADGMIVYVAGSGGEFGTLNLSNPANITYQSIGATSPLIYGMGFTSNGNLFDSDLYQINAANGNTTDLGNVGDVIGATIGPDGKTMYEFEYGPYGNLFTLTPPSPGTSFVGSSYLDNGSDGLMAFSPTGTLFTDEASGNSHNDILASVDTSTGVATLIGSGMGDYIFAGAFVNGLFFGFAPDGDVYTIDPDTGIATLYGRYNFGSGSGDYINAVTAGLPTVPEPSSLALVGIAAGALSMGSIFLRVRKREEASKQGHALRTHMFGSPGNVIALTGAQQKI
jgi:hypothetical protein